MTLFCIFTTSSSDSQSLPQLLWYASRLNGFIYYSLAHANRLDYLLISGLTGFWTLSARPLLRPLVLWTLPGLSQWLLRPPGLWTFPEPSRLYSRSSGMNGHLLGPCPRISGAGEHGWLAEVLSLPSWRDGHVMRRGERVRTREHVRSCGHVCTSDTRCSCTCVWWRLDLALTLQSSGIDELVALVSEHFTTYTPRWLNRVLAIGPRNCLEQYIATLSVWQVMASQCRISQVLIGTQHRTSYWYLGTNGCQETSWRDWLIF